MNFRPLLALSCVCLVACATKPVPGPALRPDKLAAMDAAVEQAMVDKKCPGGVLWVESQGRAYHKAYGHRSVQPALEVMTENTIFDAASLTKVMATTPAIMKLTERGAVNLNAPVETYIPEFKGDGREAVTVRHLLTHTSGLPPGISTRGNWQGQAAAIELACSAKLESAPGSVFKYSDINFILLGEIVQRASHRPLEEFVQRELYQPLRMTDTRYLPPAEQRSRIAPTEVVDGQPLRGVVHDPTARKMGCVAGHAGLFTTAADLARFARMMLNEGRLGDVQVFQPETVRLMTTVQTPPGLSVQRGLGWDIASPYSNPRGKLFSPNSYGHTGWTGTSIWLVPPSESFVIFLSNRNHPTEAGSVKRLRETLGTLAAEAIGLDAGGATVRSQPRQKQ